MSTLTPTQAKALQIIVSGTIEAVKAAGDSGAPGGVLYAAMQTQGCTLNQFTSLMGALVRTGKLRSETVGNGDAGYTLYFAVQS